MSPELVLEKPYDHTADLWFVAGSVLLHVTYCLTVGAVTKIQ